MKIELNQISEKPFQINETIFFPKEYFNNNLILGTKEIAIKGSIYLNSAEEVILDIDLVGIIIIPDSYSKEAVDYKIDIDLVENLGELSAISENTLDILDILWENIVLEVPIRFVSDESALAKSGEGWELIDEEVKKVDPRLAKLQELFEEGKE